MDAAVVSSKLHILESLVDDEAFQSLPTSDFNFASNRRKRLSKRRNVRRNGIRFCNSG